MDDEISGRILRPWYRIIIPFAMLAGIVFSSCFSYVKVITDDHSAITDPKERWEAYGIQDYEFRMDGYRGDSITGTVRVLVEFGWKEKITYIDPPRPSQYPTKGGVQVKGFSFNAIFHDLERFRKEDTIRYQVEYDERFGFPRYVNILMRRKASSGSWEWGMGEPSRGPLREYDTVGMHYRIREFHALELDY